MLYKNLSVRELYVSLPTVIIEDMMQIGIEAKNDRLAISAMEEILRRGDTDLIVKTLDRAFENKSLTENELLFYMIGRSLHESTRELDPMLYLYSKAIVQEGIFMSPSAWAKMEAPRFQKVHRSGAVKNAHPWAKQFLNPDEDHQDASRRLLIIDEEKDI